jgi:hypothetical protein
MIEVWLGPTIGYVMVKTEEELKADFEREYGHLLRRLRGDDVLEVCAREIDVIP